MSLQRRMWVEQTRSSSHLLVQGTVEIELARLVIRLLLVQYLSFSNMLMLSSMHHIDTHIF